MNVYKIIGIKVISLSDYIESNGSCDILQLVTKDNGWKIHDYNGQQY